VADSDLVAPLENQPAVWDDVGPGQAQWLEPAVEWYLDPDAHDVFMAADGPSEWQRVHHGERPDEVPLEPVQVSEIDAGDDRISFDVDEIGQPVLARASYFPNWDASGAEGPYRVAPNLMVVIPTETHVSLHYGWTPIDLLAWLLTLLGLAGLVVLIRRPPVEVPPPGPDEVWPVAREDGDEYEVEGEEPVVVDDDGWSLPPEDAPDPEHAPQREPDEVPVGAAD